MKSPEPVCVLPVFEADPIDLRTDRVTCRSGLSASVNVLEFGWAVEKAVTGPSGTDPSASDDAALIEGPETSDGRRARDWQPFHCSLDLTDQLEHLARSNYGNRNTPLIPGNVFRTTMGLGSLAPD